jgi:hypothetical protein
MMVTQDNQGAIDLYSRINDPIAAIKTAGDFFARSGMFGCDRIEQGMVLAMACMAERKSPVEIAATYHLQDGKLSMKAEAMLGRFHAIGGKSRIISRTPEKAEVELTKGDGKATFAFTLDEAKSEEYVYAKDGKTFKKNWSTPRKRMQMLWARVISDGVRAMAPEVLNGSYTPEEISEEISTVEPKPILTKVEAAPEKKATVVEVATVIEPAPKTETRATPEPPHTPPVAETIANAPAPTTERFIAKANAQTGKLTPETVEALSNLLGSGENEALAMKWLEKKEWIKPMGAIGELSVARAQKIFDKPNDFLKAIKEAK